MVSSTSSTTATLSRFTPSTAVKPSCAGPCRLEPRELPDGRGEEVATSLAMYLAWSTDLSEIWAWASDSAVMAVDTSRFVSFASFVSCESFSGVPSSSCSSRPCISSVPELVFLWYFFKILRHASRLTSRNWLSSSRLRRASTTASMTSAPSRLDDNDDPGTLVLD